MSRILLASALLAGLAAPIMARAELVQFHATLTGAAEVPPKAVPGTGDALATLDTTTKTLSYVVTYSGLTGPALMGHFHGPAMAGANAAVVVPFKSPMSPIVDKVTLTDAQIADLMAGKWYANLHTDANKGGEIRGQMMK